MQTLSTKIIAEDPWKKLKAYTDARIALGRCGGSLPLKEYLNFKLSHARARDAVHQRVHVEQLLEHIKKYSQDPLVLRSSACSRQEYLTRPDKGRILDEESVATLREQETGYDLAIIICDGLSAPAIDQSAADTVSALFGIVNDTSLRCSPVCYVENGRVAIGDHIGQLLTARMTILLIGERPGLSSPNSMGAYLTFNPRQGTTDEARNCISNIRPGGLPIEEAVRKIAYLVEEAFKNGKTGVELKDRMGEGYIPLRSFLIDSA